MNEALESRDNPKRIAQYVVSALLICGGVAVLTKYDKQLSNDGFVSVVQDVDLVGDVRASVSRSLYQGIDTTGRANEGRIFRYGLDCANSGFGLSATAHYADLDSDGFVENIDTAVVVDDGKSQSLFNEWNGAPVPPMVPDRDDIDKSIYVNHWLSGLEDSRWVYAECERLMVEYDANKNF